MIGVFMTVRIKPRKSKRFIELIEKLRLDVHANEPETLVFEVQQDRADPALFYFTEIFASEAARELHAAAPYHQAMSDEGWLCVDGQPDIRSCEPIGNFSNKDNSLEKSA